MITSRVSPLSYDFRKNLKNMAMELSEVSGKRYIIKRKSRPIQDGGGFYYARRDSRLAALVDWVFPSFNALVVISGMHDEETGELDINTKVKQKRYESLVRKHIANFFMGINEGES